ncbi:MAG: DNRLRE domain-containing protein [Chloroflexota bacterium]
MKNKIHPFAINSRTALALITCILLLPSTTAWRKTDTLPDFSTSAIGYQPASSQANCPPLPAPGGATVTVSTEAALRYQAANAAPGTTILVASGTYHLQNTVQVLKNNITIRSQTGNRGDVILDAGGMLTGLTHAIYIDADDATIADLTIRNAGEHGISVQGRDRPVLYNLHIRDTGYQLVKVNPLNGGSDNGLLACSRLEYTTTAPEDYTNGISAHDAHGWVVRDNQWYRIRTPNNVPAPTILFWSGSSGTLVERNLLVDCYQGIAFGNASHGSGDHTGGIVRNNFIYASKRHDSVIEMVHATGWLVANNTALLLNPEPGLTWGMEARFADSTGTFAYNLTNLDILNRDGAGAARTGNVTSAGSSWFINPAAGNLHLRPTATGAIDRAATLAQVSDDFDGESRPTGTAPDVGADEYSQDNSPTIRKVQFRSAGDKDGWILESGESTNKGGSLNAGSAVFRLGDNLARKQYRSVLSFSTQGLPDNAIITKVTLKVKRQGITGGGNPVTAFLGFMVDVKKGIFGASALQITDFQAAANKTYGPFKPVLVNGWYSINLTNAKAYVNKLASNGGLTQIRLRFKLDDNNGVANYLSLYSGNAPSTSRPKLIIEYYVP